MGRESGVWGKPNWKDRLKRDNMTETSEPGYSLRGWGLEKGHTKTRSILLGQQTPHPKKRYRSNYSPKLGSDKGSHGVYSIADLDEFMNNGYSSQPVIGIISYGGITRNNTPSGYIRSHLTEILKLYIDSKEAEADPSLVYHLSHHYKVPVSIFTDREDLRDQLYSDLTILENLPSNQVKFSSVYEVANALKTGELPSEKEWIRQREADTYTHPLPYPHFPITSYESREDYTREHPTQIRYLEGANEALQNARKHRDEYYRFIQSDPHNEFRLHIFTSFSPVTWARTEEEALKYEGWSNVTYKELMEKLGNKEFSPGSYLLLERRPKGNALWLEKASKDEGTTFTQSYLHHLGSEAAFRIDEEGNPHRFSDFSNIRWEFRDPKTKEFYSLEGAMDLLSNGTWDDTLRNKLLAERFNPQQGEDRSYRDIPEEAKFLYKTRQFDDAGTFLPKFIASLQEGSEGPPKMSPSEVEFFNKDLLIKGFLGSRLRDKDLKLLAKSSEIMPQSEMDKYSWNKGDNSLTYLPTGERSPFSDIQAGLRREIEASKFHVDL